MDYQVSENIQNMLNEYGMINNDKDKRTFFDVSKRTIIANELIKIFNDNHMALPEYHIKTQQFSFDGNMNITCGEYKQWRITIWSNGDIDCNTQDNGRFSSETIKLYNAMSNPQIILDNMVKLINAFCEYKGVSFYELEWQPDGDWGYGCWKEYDQSKYC
jgi:hypothetical protein